MVVVDLGIASSFDYSFYLLVVVVIRLLGV